MTEENQNIEANDTKNMSKPTKEKKFGKKPKPKETKDKKIEKNESGDFAEKLDLDDGVKIKKKASPFRYVMNTGVMFSEIHGYGYDYSFKSFMKQILLVFGALIGVAYLYQLKAVWIILLLLLAIMCLPFAISSHYKYMYEYKRFSDAINYMEQMLYSFRKRPKILASLHDTFDSSTGDVKECIGKAIDYLEHSSYNESPLKEALNFIYEKYTCRRMASMNEFMIKVEQEGGDYRESLDIMLDDLREWTKTTSLFQKEREGVKSKVQIAIGLSLLITFVTVKIVPEQFSITGDTVYQVVTFIVLALLIITYILVQTKINAPWLESDTSYEKQMVIDMDRFHNLDVKTARKKKMPIVIVCIVAGAAFAVMGLTMKTNLYYAVAALMVFLGYFMYKQPENQIKNAKKRLVREINKQFPNWLRALALTLQSRTVQVAIAESIPDAPPVLQPYLRKLIEDFNADPVSIIPYSNFLSEFNLPEISSVMKMLYSLNGMGIEGAQQQINVIVERNNKLLNQAEKIENDEKVSGLGFIVALPMVYSVFKLLIDLFLIMMSFMSVMGSAMVFNGF